MASFSLDTSRFKGSQASANVLSKSPPDNSNVQVFFRAVLRRLIQAQPFPKGQSFAADLSYELFTSYQYGAIGSSYKNRSMDIHPLDDERSTSKIYT